MATHYTALGTLLQAPPLDPFHLAISRWQLVTRRSESIRTRTGSARHALLVGLTRTTGSAGYAGDPVKYFRDMPVIGGHYLRLGSRARRARRSRSVEDEGRPPPSHEWTVAARGPETSGAEDVADVGP